MPLARRYLYFELICAAVALLILVGEQGGWWASLGLGMTIGAYFILGSLLVLLLLGNVIGIFKSWGMPDDIRFYLGGSIAIMATLYMNLMFLNDVVANLPAAGS